MSGPSLLFCSIAEREFNAVVSLINTAIVLPVFALRQLRSQVKLFQQLTLDANEIILDEIEEILLSLIDINKIKGFSNFEQKRLSFCAAAFSCRAVMETLFPPDGNTDGSDDPVYIQGIPLSARNTFRTAGSGFDEFEKLVCKLSLRGILDGFIDDYIESLEKILDDILDALGFNKIDELISIYLSKLGPILDLLESLDKFADCAFDTCNFTATSLNKQEDIGDRLSVIRQGTGWAFKIESSLQAVFDQEANMRLRISNLRTQLSNVSVSPQGFIGPDEVMV